MFQSYSSLPPYFYYFQRMSGLSSLSWPGWRYCCWWWGRWGTWYRWGEYWEYSWYRSWSRTMERTVLPMVFLTYYRGNRTSYIEYSGSSLSSLGSVWMSSHLVHKYPDSVYKNTISYFIIQGHQLFICLAISLSDHQADKWGCNESPNQSDSN